MLLKRCLFATLAATIAPISGCNSPSSKPDNDWDIVSDPQANPGVKPLRNFRKIASVWAVGCAGGETSNLNEAGTANFPDTDNCAGPEETYVEAPGGGFTELGPTEISTTHDELQEGQYRFKFKFKRIKDDDGEDCNGVVLTIRLGLANGKQQKIRMQRCLVGSQGARGAPVNIRAAHYQTNTDASLDDMMAFLDWLAVPNEDGTNKTPYRMFRFVRRGTGWVNGVGTHTCNSDGLPYNTPFLFEHDPNASINQIQTQLESTRAHPEPSIATNTCTRAETNVANGTGDWHGKQHYAKDVPVLTNANYLAPLEYGVEYQQLVCQDKLATAVPPLPSSLERIGKNTAQRYARPEQQSPALATLGRPKINKDTGEELWNGTTPVPCADDTDCDMAYVSSNACETDNDCTDKKETCLEGYCKKPKTPIAAYWYRGFKHTCFKANANSGKVTVLNASQQLIERNGGGTKNNLCYLSLGRAEPEGIVVSAINLDEDELTLASNHGLSTGAAIQFFTRDILPGGINKAAPTNHYAIVTAANKLKVSTTAAQATSGQAINITGEGNGELILINPSLPVMAKLVSEFGVSGANSIAETRRFYTSSASPQQTRCANSPGTATPSCAELPYRATIRNIDPDPNDAIPASDTNSLGIATSGCELKPAITDDTD